LPIVGTKELADAAGVSRQRIWQWERDDGMPGKLSRGKWDSEVALPWIAERRPDTVPDSPEQAQTLNDLRCRLTGLQADAQELRNGILAGNLLLRDSVENANREEYAALISEGDTWVSEGRTAHDQALRRELWNEVRTRLVGAVERLAATYARGEDVAAARIRYAGRVG